MTLPHDDNASETQKPGVAFIHESFPLGGAERRTIDIAAHLDKRGFRVFVFTAHVKEELLPERTAFDLIKLPQGHVSRSMPDARFLVGRIRELRIGTVVVPVLRMKHMPFIVRNTGVKYIYANHGSPFWDVSAAIAAVVKKYRHGFLNRIKWYAYHYPAFFWFGKQQRRVYRRYRETIDLTDKYVVLCQEYKDEILQRLKRRRFNEKIVVIPNPQRSVEPVNFDKKKQLLFVGRLTHADKRPDRLVEIWSRIHEEFPDYEFIIVGDGEERPLLERMIAERKLPRIRLAGSTNNVQAYYETASVLLLTSSIESWGLVLTEAQANGVLPIAFNCSAGVRTILSPSGKNGILVPAFDMEAYIRELKALLRDPERMERMRRDVVERVKEFNPDAIEGKWESLILNLRRTASPS